jgi:hypothetical protein
VNKITVVELQLHPIGVLGALHSGLFAYNEAPTFAVANDCWFQGASLSDAPFFLARPF